MEMNILTTPFIALDYLTKGDPSNLNPERIQIADKWAEDWEIVSVGEIPIEETEGYSVNKVGFSDVAEDREYDDDYEKIA